MLVRAVCRIRSRTAHVKPFLNYPLYIGHDDVSRGLSCQPSLGQRTLNRSNASIQPKLHMSRRAARTDQRGTRSTFWIPVSRCESIGHQPEETRTIPAMGILNSLDRRLRFRC